jgi:hypothetical protein
MGTIFYLNLATFYFQPHCLKITNLPKWLYSNYANGQKQICTKLLFQKFLNTKLCPFLILLSNIKSKLIMQDFSKFGSLHKWLFLFVG